MTTPRIVLIHATPVAIEPIRDAFAALWPEAEPVNLLDEALAIDRARDPDITPAIRSRILRLAEYGASLGARGILFTCSAFGAAIEEAATHLDIPVLKPNEAMFEDVLRHGDRIGMIATFAPAIGTMEDEFAADARRLRPAATLTSRLAAGAMAALRAGDAGRHNRLVAEEAARFEGVDALMLAHFSTSRALEACRAATTIPVLTAPEAAIRRIRRAIGA